jgi:hypothetical protein
MLGLFAVCDGILYRGASLRLSLIFGLLILDGENL